MSIPRIVAGPVLGLAVVVFVSLMVWRLSTPRDQSANEADGKVEAIEQVERSPSFSETESASALSAQQPVTGTELAPAEVIDRPGFDCSMARGQGHAADLAIVAISEFGGNARHPAQLSTMHSTRFSVLDQTGALHTGELPFHPLQIKIGKRPHGPVLAGFGGLDPAPSRMRLTAEGEPARIFMDGAAVYENDHAWLLGVASDGSSYFVVEPLGSDLSSRLVIRNLDQGTEAHHELGTMLAAPEGGLAYHASYTPGNEEVHLEPASGPYSRGIGAHYFFKAEGKEPPRRISVPDRGLDDRALFLSSEEGYFFYEGANNADSLEIVKARFDWPAGFSQAIWRQDNAVGTRAVREDASPDGAWLLLRTGTASTAGRPAKRSDSMLHVLDASTGKKVFALPTSNVEAQLRQLSSVLPDQPTENDLGWYNGAFFTGNGKLVVQRVQDTDGLVDETVKFYDVYDMESIAIDAQPEFRARSNQHQRNPCASKGFPGTLQVAESGRLAYSGAP